MHTIHVHRHVAASPQQMHDLLSDPATFRSFPGVKHAELLRPGHTHRFGVGAVRRIHVSGFRYDEEIVQSELGRLIAYRVVTSRPRLDHEIGLIRFEATANGCDVTWTTTYRVPAPVVGPLLARVGGWRMRRAFDDAIRVAGELAGVSADAGALG